MAGKNAIVREPFIALRPSRKRLLVVVEVLAAVGLGIFLILRFYQMQELVAAFILFGVACAPFVALALALFVMGAIRQSLVHREEATHPR
ncbi:MAG TPA: hypothetical protein VEX69_02460 [Candidatus Limnocylindria bacterium]|nr:hypothetical protein [Candidatus Limnocylindria bacterium]